MNRILFLLLFISNAAIAQVNLTQGLVAYYPFTGNANDASGNSNNPIFNNATLTSDRFGNPNSAYLFNGIDNYIQIPNSPSLNPTNQVSICAWVKVNGFYQGTCHGNAVVMKGDQDFLAGNYALRFDDNPYSNSQNCSTSFVDLNHENFYAVNLMSASPGYTPYIQTGQWYSIIYTSDGVTSKLYVNCQLKISAPANGITFSNAYDLFLGKMNNATYPYWFNGVMDEVRIYNRALNQDEVNTYGGCSTLSCNDWLSTPSYQSYVSVGDLDVPGDKITVEALINRTQAYLPGTGNNTEGDVVSKHLDPSNANYLLRPNHAYITTTNGFFATPDVCEIELNRTYHIAMVYDGSTLKYYRDGFLMSSVPATGTLFQNDFNTRIGYYDATFWNTNFLGYINEVRIWNVARTQSEIQAYMNSSLPSPTTQSGLLAYYTFNDLTNKQGNTTFDGTLGGTASINATNPDCTFIPDSCQLSCDINHDFAFQRLACDPFSIDFLPTAATYDSIGWDFGDGNIITNNSNPTHLYSNTGNYTVKMIVNNGPCIDTIIKAISVDVLQDNQLIRTNDTTICIGTTKQLLTTPSLSFCWTPTTYLDDPNSATPTTSTTQNITYYYTAQTVGNNLITNGDFSAGNSGFTSQYIYANPNVTEGQYFIGANPQAWNSSLSACHDHTNGTGNMMMVNGSPTADLEVWKGTITVTPNTNYAFSTWIQALWPPNPAQLQFSINGKDIGSLITASLPTCTWTQFYTTWNSGNNTSATIAIINKNTQVLGNDFALDDISFAPVYMKRDSVIIKVDSPYIKTNNDTTYCEGGQTQFNTTGATTYSWSPTTFLNNPNIGNPVATPTTTTQYIVTGTNSFGCDAKDTVLITVNPKPTITISNDTTICKNTSAQLIASGGTIYSWAPPATLNNPNISNPLATISDSTLYYVTVTDANTCTNIDSVYVNVFPDPAFTINNTSNICLNSSTQLNASGGNVYSWQPATFLNNPNIANPIATPTSTTNYTVQITETTCNNSTTLSTTVNVFPLPTISINKSNDIDCSNDNSRLSATGAVQYSWSPSSTLSNPSIPNPVARPAVTTLYTVQGKDANGCINTDTITVYVNGVNKGGYLMPNAFTPNGDGINDCYGIKYWGVIQELDFSIYNRWGQCIFHATQPGQCWDGTFKGQKQNPDVYVYMIKAKTFCDDYVFRKGTFVLVR